MDFLNPIFLIPATTGPFFILMGIIMLKFPPKNINSFYGYRTISSMKSKERWDFSQRYSAWLMIKTGAVLSLTSVLGFFVSTSEAIGTLLGMGILIAYAVFLIVRTENAIKEKFGKK
jgi:uncharacterized membrane protein